MKNDSKAIQDAFCRVQTLLKELGLMEGKDGHLEQIGLVVSALPAVWNNAFFFHKGTRWFDGLFGYEEGVIYIRSNPAVGDELGESLEELIAHEFGHAWAWMDETFFAKKWFKKAFKAKYYDGSGPHWEYYEGVKDMSYEEFLEYDMSDKYATPYSLYSPAEDFAETFMLYCGCKGKIGRYQDRPGLYRKLRAIKKAIKKVKKSR